MDDTVDGPVGAQDASSGSPASYEGQEGATAVPCIDAKPSVSCGRNTSCLKTCVNPGVFLRGERTNWPGLGIKPSDITTVKRQQQKLEEINQDPHRGHTCLWWSLCWEEVSGG
jgi:hypothetical protein